MSKYFARRVPPPTSFSYPCTWEFPDGEAMRTFLWIEGLRNRHATGEREAKTEDGSTWTWGEVES